jgi:hypothetical protein
VSAGAGGFVVLERHDGLWGVAGTAVRRLSGGGGRELTVELESGAIAADRVLAVVPGMAVVPAPRALARFWPESAHGLAVYGERPVLVIDPSRPPSMLLAAAAAGDLDEEEGGAGHGE